MNDVTFTLTLFIALGSGLMAGVFFAFSTFVMRALALLQPPQGIEAMQAINRTVINPWFLGIFLGTAAGCLLLGGLTLWRGSQPSSIYLVAGCTLYFIGTFLVTGAFNVPMNNVLEGVEPTSKEASSLWSNYLTKWTAWNHVRTIAALLAAALFTIGLR